MPWQEVVDHVSDQRIVVESRSGNRYPVETEYDWLGEDVYKFEMGDMAHDELWAWVEFPDDGDPICTWTSTGSPTGGPPENPPGEN